MNVGAIQTNGNVRSGISPSKHKDPTPIRTETDNHRRRISKLGNLMRVRALRILNPRKLAERTAGTTVEKSIDACIAKLICEIGRG